VQYFTLQYVVFIVSEVELRNSISSVVPDEEWHDGDEDGVDPVPRTPQE
jgi:hypothetical protein